jgi:hypothetical protein
MFLRPTLISLLFCSAAAQLLMLPAFAQEEATSSSIPLSTAWNIASSGKASSSGELLFRVTPGDGRDPVEVTVFVLSGANETGVASSIRRALSTQLDTQRFDVQAGQGASVLVTSEAGAGAGAANGFSLELLDSDVENVRVMVQSAMPVAPPTVPSQNVPANPPTPARPATPATPAAPGDAVPPTTPQNPASLPPATPDPDAPTNPGPTLPNPNTPVSPAPSAPAPNSPASPAPNTPAPRATPSPPPSTPAPSTPTSPAPAPGAAPAGAQGGAGAGAAAPPPGG